VDFTRFAGQLGNLAGNLLFRGRPQIDPYYMQMQEQMYAPKVEVEESPEFEPFEIDGIILPDLFKKAKKKKEEAILPYRPNEEPEDLFGSDSCAECRARQARSGMMNIMDPCRGVCGG